MSGGSGSSSFGSGSSGFGSGTAGFESSFGGLGSSAFGGSSSNAFRMGSGGFGGSGMNMLNTMVYSRYPSGMQPIAMPGFSSVVRLRPVKVQLRRRFRGDDSDEDD